MDKNKKILVVEDEQLLASLYGKKLIEAGYQTEIATNGFDGYKKALDFKPDLILMDILMPKANGYQMLKLLRQDQKTKRIPAVIMTNSPSLPDAREAKELGVVKGFFKTEVTPSEILKYVESFFINEAAVGERG